MAKDEKAATPRRRKDDPPPTVATLAGHPRAARDLMRARGWGALLGFLVVAWLAWQAGAAPVDIVLRALFGGTVGMLAGWAAAVAAWRSLAVAQIRAANRAYEDALRSHADAPEGQTQTA